MSGTNWKLGRLTRTRADGSKYTSYIIRWVDAAGTRHRVSLDTADKATASAKARDYWAAIKFAAAGTVGEVMNAYLDSLNGTKDEKRKREGWVAAKPFWDAIPVSSVDNDTSGEYVAWRKRAANTVRNELGPIRTALNWAERVGRIDKAPCITLPSMPQSTVGHLTKQQFRELLAQCLAPHVALFAQLAVCTGARPTAVLEVTWDQIDWVGAY